ncbi:transporter substrate-binding domain-containing protein [Pseudoalteromonas sp. SMS1]|uniref:substrate-binding periplasmic protein n=1 Tax=Pseudoalteromonas sp. SMS1 TaxID=2908894 RepID=UPI001F21CD12|nr:transporter substrate-binding domain-containing protein [Pseudoalteromonas sp. SMS1]MCF2857946.1 transporter substrate-binding domain-containing protein [Pseudoalteromonas sp. SMS1]
MQALSRIFWTLILITLFACQTSYALQGQFAIKPRVTILVDDSYPPYSYVSNGYLYGIYVEQVKLAARQLSDHYQITLEAIPWKRGVAAMESGEAFALMPPYIHKDKRPYIWPYSISLGEEAVVAFCNQGITLNGILKRQPQLGPINIGINAGFLILDDELSKAREKGLIKIWENKDTESNIKKLSKNRLDCYLNDRLSTVMGIEALKSELHTLDIKQFKEDKIVLTRTAHIGYTKENGERFPYKLDFIEKMNKALRDVQASSKQ